MKKLIIVSLTALAVLIGGQGYAEAEPVYNPDNGHYYEAFCAERISWETAKAEAESMTYMGIPGHLATVTSEEENTFLANFYEMHCGDQYRMFWLGGFQPPGSPEPDGNWQWVTGEPFEYDNWRQGEPNDSPCLYGGFSENAIDFYGYGLGQGEWNDFCWGHYVYTSNYVVEYSPELSPPIYSCSGFEPPMATGPVTVEKNRALPHKAQLFDSEGFSVTDADIAAPPVIQVLFDSGTGIESVDVTDDALPSGVGTEGNQFVYTEDYMWQFNLKIKNYTASGTYTVTMEPGDESYTIDPVCEATFVIK
jgi:hypothetical protein